jgi:hypothetical protein
MDAPIPSTQNEKEVIKRKLAAFADSLKEEFPQNGIFILVVNGLGEFATAGNGLPAHMAATLEHAVRHIKGECKC